MDDNTVFLTFDDGPNPDITPFVLDLLKKYNWKATFFCVGENIQRYPEIVERMLIEGHRIGNHTYRHENGYETSNFNYLRSYRQFQEVHQTNLFRPPYGKIKSQPAKTITRFSKIIMWSWLTYDFDLSYPSDEILNDAEKMKSGDIIVLHDNAKFNSRNLKLFPDLFAKIHEMGFKSKAIQDQ